MLLLAMASLLSAPAPEAPSKWFNWRDLPDTELVGNGILVVPYRVTVLPSGKPASCEVETTSGNTEVDSLTCNLIRKRARFSPARDESGQPTIGVYRASNVWFTALNGPEPDVSVMGDIDLSVKTLPAGLKSPTSVRVMFAVDPSGKLSSCTGERAGDNPALVSAACSAVGSSFSAKPAMAAGAPVHSIQDATVRFIEN